MPFRSKAQAKYMFAKKPAMAKEFASKTPSIKALPNKVKVPKKAKMPSMKQMKTKPLNQLTAQMGGGNGY